MNNNLGSTAADRGAPMNTPEETFRQTLRGRNPENEPSTLIITRQGLGRAGRVWLTFVGAIKTTVVLTDQEARQLAELLESAAGARATP